MTRLVASCAVCLLVALADSAAQQAEDTPRASGANGTGRCRSLLAIGDRPDAPADGVELLHAALAETDAGVRACAAVALGTLGPTARAAVPGLIGVATGANASARAAALAALVDVAPDAPEVTEALRRGVHDEDWTVRAEAVSALARVPVAGDARSLAVAATGDTSLGVRAAAFRALDRLLTSDAERADTWRSILAQHGHAGRFMAARRLAAMGAPGKAAANELVDTLRNGEPFERGATARALAEVGCSTPDCRGALIAALKDRSAEVRLEVVQALAAFGPQSAEAVPALVSLLEGETRFELRFQVTGTLERIGPGAAAAVPALVAELRDPWLGSHASKALSAIGAAAVPALRELALRRSSASPWSDGRQAAVDALSRIDTPEAKAAVAEYRRRQAEGEQR